MSEDFTIRSSTDLGALKRRIGEHADAKAIRRDLYKGLNSATKKIRKDMKDSIPSHLPRSGGLGAFVASRASFTSGMFGGVSSTGIRIKGGGKSNLAAYNEGRFRHPVYGNSSVWVEQTAGVDQGFLDDVFQHSGDEVKREILRVLDEISRKVQG